MKLDIIDKRIIVNLEKNARMPLSQIAKKIRISKERVRYRIARLEKKGIISGYQTFLNMSHLGYQHLRLFLQFQRTTPEKDKEIFEFIRSKSICTGLKQLEGRYDLSVILVSKSIHKINQFLKELRDSFGDCFSEKEIHLLLSKTSYLTQKRIVTTYESEEDLEVDDLDLKIINLLSDSARISAVNIAKKVGKSPKVVIYRIKKLERKDILILYSCIVNLTNLKQFETILGIHLTTPKSGNKIMEFLANTGACKSVDEMIGKYDLLAVIHADSQKNMKKIMDKFRTQFVEDYAYYDIMGTTKTMASEWKSV